MNNKTRRSPPSQPKRVLLILFVLAAPFVVLVVFLYPWITASNSRKYVAHYRLPSGFTKTHINEAVAHMRADTEYQFYFKMLSPKSVEQAVDNAYSVLDKNRDKTRHLAQVTLLKERVEAKAVLLNNLHYPGDFDKNPAAYPDLLKEFWSFLIEEFHLTILGLCYKSTYDLDFQFEWNQGTVQAAQRLEGIFLKLTETQRQAIEFNALAGLKP